MKNQVLLLNEIRDNLKSVLKKIDDINTSSCVVNVSISDSVDVGYLSDFKSQNRLKTEDKESILREHCRKLGLDDDTVLEYDSELENYDHNANYGNNSLTYDQDTDTLWNRNGVIYSKGKFARPSGGLRKTKHIFKSGRKYDGGLHFFDFFASIKPQLGDTVELQEGIKLEIIDTPTKVSDHSYCFGVKKI